MIELDGGGANLGVAGCGILKDPPVLSPSSMSWSLLLLSSAMALAVGWESFPSVREELNTALNGGSGTDPCLELDVETQSSWGRSLPSKDRYLLWVRGLNDSQDEKVYQTKIWNCWPRRLAADPSQRTPYLWLWAELSFLVLC